MIVVSLCPEYSGQERTLFKWDSNREKFLFSFHLRLRDEYFIFTPRGLGKTIAENLF